MPHISQNLSFVKGWNAVYVEVSPEQTADELFASWPVNHVSLYDPASFLATRQFSAEWNSQGLSREAMAVWYRGVPEASSLKCVPGGSILVTFCTNNSFLATFTGPPAAPRTTWHVTGTNTVYNFVGFSTSTNNTGIAAYLEGSPCEEVLSRAYYHIEGNDPNAVPRARELRTNERTVGDGEVLLLPSDKISDWSGVLHVSPINGVNFGQTGKKSSLSIRNDGKTNRTVRVELARAINHGELFNSPNLPWALVMRDMDVAVTNGGWGMGAEMSSYYGMSYYKKLAPGETWNIEVGLDRNGLQNGDRRKGLTFGAILKITEDSAAHAKVVVPVHGETSGEEASDWQNGLWIADVAFDSINIIEQKWVIESHTEEREVVTTNMEGNVVSVTTNMEEVVVATTNAVDSALGEPTRTGGRFKLRLPIHRDRDGKARLLQRVVLAGDMAADGTFNYKLYAGSARPPDSAKTLTRISAVCLPTETPVIEATQENLWGYAYQQGNTATFEFTVGAYGATSLLRHPYHPQHDGLRWDFVTHSPDGDDVYNYKSDIKPETFSVKNTIKLEITVGDGVTAWSPEESFNGTCEWTLSGLRHDGKIVVSGPMVLKRISPNVQLVLK